MSDAKPVPEERDQALWEAIGDGDVDAAELTRDKLVVAIEQIAASGERTQEIVKTISYREGGSTAPPPPGHGEGDDGFFEEATALVGAIGAALAILVVLVGLVASS